MLTPGRPNRSCSSRSDRAGTPRTKRHETSCRSRHARRDRTTRWEEAKAGPSPRLDTEAYKGQEPPHAFRRGQRTRSVSYPRSSSWELEGASWGLDEHVAVRWPCCDAVNVDTRHARTCPGAGAQVNQHQARNLLRAEGVLGFLTKSRAGNPSRRTGVYGRTSS